MWPKHCYQVTLPVILWYYVTKKLLSGDVSSYSLQLCDQKVVIKWHLELLFATMWAKCCYQVTLAAILCYYLTKKLLSSDVSSYSFANMWPKRFLSGIISSYSLPLCERKGCYQVTLAATLCYYVTKNLSSSDVTATLCYYVTKKLLSSDVSSYSLLLCDQTFVIKWR